MSKCYRVVILTTVGLLLLAGAGLVGVSTQMNDRGLRMSAPDDPVELHLSSSTSVPSISSTQINRMNQMPLSFTKNVGQWDEDVLFRANAGGTTMWFTKEGVAYGFTRRSKTNRQGYASKPIRSEHETNDGGVPNTAVPTFTHTVNQSGQCSLEADPVEQLTLTATFMGANPNPEAVGENRMVYRCSYFVGNDPAMWRTDVPNYSTLVYKDVYPGIDLKFYGTGTQIEYDFILSPGADPSQIAIHYEGAEYVCVDDRGQLVVGTEWGEVTEHAPLVYQNIDGEKRPLGGGYSLRNDNVFGFEIATDYHPEFALVIDPVLSYSTYLGGSDFDWGYAIAVDDSGSAFVTGYTSSADFPTQNPYDGSFNGGDVLVTRLSPLGNALVYSTYLGGSSFDKGLGIAVDGSGSAYVTGQTESADFPTQNPHDGSFNPGSSSEVFVTKLSPLGNALVYSTYLGGSNYDYGFGISVDDSGSAFVTGQTSSADFPTQNSYDGSFNGTVDVFVTKLSPLGNALVYSTYLGGGYYDFGFGIAVDGSGSAYVTGQTQSVDFPMQNPYDGTFNGLEDAFVSKLSPMGDTLVYSTYLGGSIWDAGNAIAVDGGGSAYVTGQTYSANFPTQNPYDGMFNSVYDVFVTKLSPLGNALVYSTYLGGSSFDKGFGIAVDGSGSAYVTGQTQSADFPTKNSYDGSFNGTVDVFVTKLSPLGNALVYSTYVGGGNDDFGSAIALDGNGSAYVTGYTRSPSFPTQNPYDGDFNGNYDAFVIKLTCDCPKQGDITGDALLDVFDVIGVIGIAFSGEQNLQDPACPTARGDVDNNGVTDVYDVLYLIATAFSGGADPINPCGG